MTLLRRHLDDLLAVCLAALITVELIVWNADERFAIGLAALSGLALAGRRRVPLPAYLVSWLSLGGVITLAPGFDNDSLGVVAIYFVALWSLGRWSSGLEAKLAVPCVLAAIVWFVAGDVGWNPDLGDVGFSIAFVGGPWAAGLVVRLRRERETVLWEQNRQLVADRQEHARRAVAAERARIARELHDVVSHAISVTVLQARGARAKLGQDEAQVRQALDAIEHTNTAALGDMRRLLAVLRDVDGDAEDQAGTAGARSPQPSLDHLDTLFDRVRAAGIDVDLDVVGVPAELPPGVDLSAYRIVQESLTNVIKHAAPARALVRLEYGEESLGVSVVDDGVHRVADGAGAAGAGHGLIGIHERVAVIGGDVTAGPQPNGGFAVCARLPYSVALG